jgi:uncharacterized protein
MNPMPDTLKGFRTALLCLWASLCLAGVIYSRRLGLPAGIALAVIPAFLVEGAFYLASGFEEVRRRIASSCPPGVLACALTLSAALPYCLYSLPAGCFHWSSLVFLGALAASVSFWYALLPRNAVVDLGFVALAAGVVLAKCFSAIYAQPAKGLHVEVLGHLMWIRVGVIALLSLRRVDGIGFGFLPRRIDWQIGIRHYVYFLPVGLPLALAVGWVRFHPVEMAWWRALPLAAVTFFAMLWVVALSEEFFFRGLLQQWLSLWLGNRTAGLAAASVLFGLAHLPFGSFPNWRFALVATVAGWFYGRAYWRAGSIRAAMVAHALVNITKLMLFNG